MATTNEEEGGGERRNGRLQVFLSSLFSTLGGVFSTVTTFQEQDNSPINMASSRAAPAIEQQQQPRGMQCFYSFLLLLLVLVIWCGFLYLGRGFLFRLGGCFSHKVCGFIEFYVNYGVSASGFFISCFKI